MLPSGFMAPTASVLALPPAFTPAIPPPPGVIPNPEHPASLAREADIAVGIIVPFITVFFLLRTYVRICIKRAWIVEDALVTTAWATTVTYCALLRTCMARHGGQHGWDITANQLHEGLYWFNVAAAVYGVCIGITKISILILYRRVFSPHRSSRFDIAIVTMIVILAGFYIAITLAKIFECNPREKIWNPSVPGTCLEIKNILNASGGFNAATDHLILLLPIHAVRKLQMPTSKRVFVVLAFTFGLSGPIFATVGFVVRLQRAGNADTTWNQPDILLWGAGEVATANLCVCFPELAVLFRRRTLIRATPQDAANSASQQYGVSRDRRAKRSPFDRYLPKSFKGTLSTRLSDNYLELRDEPSRHTVNISPGEVISGEETVRDNVIVLHNEITVTHEPVRGRERESYGMPPRMVANQDPASFPET
ncbi:hypothetical protein F5Y17DRAFT_411758 [Xylariaceae sp. FL0594]|nr:hypothetical protein F5Y17DRAFT_411758 [Xylariaceae sp. FL0594]